jgi:hypothetical protein
MMRIVNDRIDIVEEDLTRSISQSREKPAKIKYILTGTRAKLEINLEGPPEQTSETVEQISRAITSYFNSGVLENAA